MNKKLTDVPDHTAGNYNHMNEKQIKRGKHEKMSGGK